jgi:hypothetical protein
MNNGDQMAGVLDSRLITGRQSNGHSMSGPFNYHTVINKMAAQNAKNT